MNAPSNNEALIAEARRLADAATPGPWQNEPDTGAGRVWVQRSPYKHHAHIVDAEPLFNIRGPEEPEKYPQRAADAEFIARSRTLVPELVSALEVQAAKVTELEAELTEERDTFDLLDKAYDEKAAEVAKLTADLATARRDALNEAIAVIRGEDEIDAAGSIDVRYAVELISDLFPTLGADTDIARATTPEEKN